MVVSGKSRRLASSLPSPVPEHTDLTETVVRRYRAEQAHSFEREGETVAGMKRMSLESPEETREFTDGKGRVAAVEILKSSPRTREYIEKGESEGKTLLDAIRDGEIDGMQDFDSVIRKLVEEKVITLEDGLSYATNQNNLLLQLKGLSSTEDYINQANNRPDTLPVIPHTPPPTSSNMASVLDMME